MKFSGKIYVIFSVLLISEPVLADHASASFETGAAGAIMTTPGATLPRGKFVLGGSMQFIEFDDIPDSTLKTFGAADEDVHSVNSLFNYQINLAYGITDNLTIGAGIPYVQRNDIRVAHNDMGMGEVEAAGDSSGIGDVRLFGQFRFLHDTLQDVAVLVGVKTPTGATSEREAGGDLFETDHQPGSGSWDPFLGAAYNRAFGRTGLSANVLYTFTGKGSQQTELGNIFDYNLAISYRLFTIMEAHHHPHGQEHVHEHHEHNNAIVQYIDAALELNGDVRDRNKISGKDEDNTGGHTVYLSPGFRIGLGRSISIYSSIGIPVVNDFNGVQSEPEYRVIGGMSLVF